MMKKRMLAGLCAVMTAFAGAKGHLYMTDRASLPALAARIGDINQDDALNAADAKALADFLLAKTGTAYGADLNNDGTVNAKDLTLLKRQLLRGQYSPGGQTLVINEVCSTNRKSLKAQDGSSPDWIELYNAGSTAADLSGIGVSDGDKNRFKFTFPAGSRLSAGDYCIIFCDDTDVTSGELHAAFKISASGETVYLTAADGTELDKVTLPELDADVTYGRTADGGSDYSLLNPTPGRTNGAAEPVYRVEKPAFSAEGGFYDSAFQLTLSAEAGNTVCYTLDGSDPRSSSTAKQYQGSIGIRDNTNDQNVYAAVREISLRGYTPPDYAVDKGMIVRAAAKDSSGVFSEVATNSYFVGKTASYYRDMKVLSVSTDSKNFFDKETGIYMIGNQYERWKNSGQFDPDLDVGSCDNPTNYNMEGREWERPCNLQVFENGKLKYTADAGVRISGNWTTAFPQKSMTFYARKEYGTNKLQHDFFEGAAFDADGTKIKEYKKVTIRNGGNGYDNCRFRDDLNQSLAEGLHLGTQAKCDYIVFLDGEFWGTYSMQEKLDENYIESHYHVDADNVTTVKNGKEYEGLESTYRDFEQFFRWAMSADMANASNYQRVCSTIDVEGFMDFVAFESYIVNWDCMLNNNNWMLWRADEPDTANPYADGKWRFLLFDTEYSCGYDGQCSPRRDYFKDMDRSGRITSIASLFFRLMNNAQFKEQFFTRYQQIVKENFDAAKVSAKIDAYAAATKDAVNDTYRRFSIGASFDSNVKIIRNFYNTRSKYALHHLNLLYGIQDNWQEDPNMIDQFGWSIWMNDGAGTIEFNDDGSITVNVTRTGQYAQVSSSTVSLQAGRTYRMTYTISTSQNISTYSMFQQGTGEYKSYYYQDHTFTPNPQTITDTVTMTQSDNNVKFLIGLDKGTGTYRISDFSMVCLN
ncbi:MAG: CotH kinase family protein [Oscillospiraceae bacterium]|nr:CotH kinase family protein [Oscillospiraceae bacterium]